jgi:pyridinium-3,5-bisthiocarboxylic acid mononucleotide nickel chelatase
MKILYYDCFSGISGDMNLGAMLDLGVSEECLISGLNALNLDGWHIETKREQRHGITGTKVTVHLSNHEDADDHHEDHNHEHHHEHHSHVEDDHHYHEQYLNLKGDELHHVAHRNLNDIEIIINNSSLSGNVKSLAINIFKKIAEAEAAVHNKPVNEVHFHEVGAVDSIVDIVGAAICFDAIGADKIYVSDIELGSGTVKCQHGILPVPAPATVNILKGFPVHTGGVSFEATTPTGAAIIAATAEKAPSELRYSIISTGYGVGHKDNPALPNLLRVHLAEVDESLVSDHNAFLVECNVDDMNPEIADYIAGKLLKNGIPDVCFIPVMMKKTRPAFIISIICEEEHLPKVREILFTESTTLGIRIIPFKKETLQREFEEVETRFGKVTVKKSYFNGRLVTIKPEADQCAAVAAANGVPMKEVIREVMNSAG